MKATVAAALACAAFAIAVPGFARAVDLDEPGVLEAIEASDPARYATIRRILAEVPRRAIGDPSTAAWMRTEFAASDVGYTDLVKTSLPPKKKLAFTLDGVSYVAIVTLRPSAKARPRKVGEPAADGVGKAASMP